MFDKKKKLTIEQFAELLYYFAKKFSVDYVPHEMNKANSLFKEANKNVFIYERLIMIFWIIDKFFADKDRKLTAAVHKQYFTDIGIINNQEKTKEEIDLIVSRYKEYYDAWNDKGPEQFILGGVIAKNIFQKEKMVLDALIISYIVGDVYALIAQIRASIFDKYELIK